MLRWMQEDMGQIVRKMAENVGLFATFADNVVRVRLYSRMELSEAEQARLRSWITGPQERP
jgi:hypothetical protein